MHSHLSEAGKTAWSEAFPWNLGTDLFFQSAVVQLGNPDGRDKLKRVLKQIEEEGEPRADLEITIELHATSEAKARIDAGLLGARKFDVNIKKTFVSSITNFHF